MLHWFPRINIGTFTGQGQGPWSVSGNSTYIVYGGEFTQINGKGQQGLVRFGTKAAAPNKIGPVYNGTVQNPSAVSLQPGTARIAWPATYDPDSSELTYELFRDNATVPVYTVKSRSDSWTSSYLSTPTSAPMGFVDTGLANGSSHTWRLKISDSDGNNIDNMKSAATVITSTAPSAYALAVLADNPTAFWRLGEGGTTAFDWKAFNDATASTGVAGAAAGAINGDSNPASTFDGTSAGVVVSKSTMPTTPSFSVEAWVNTSSTSGGKIVGYGNAATGDSGSYDRHVYMDNAGRIIWGVYPGGVRSLSSGPGYNDGQFHHIVASLDATNGTELWVDGKRVARDPGTTSAQAYLGYWRIGGDNLGGWPNKPTSNYLQGTIDDVAIYDAALSKTTVLAHYVASGRVSPVPPVPGDVYGAAVYNDEPDLFWRLGELSGTVAKDSGPNASDGVYTGGVTLGATGAVTGTTNTAASFDGVNGGVYSNAPVTNPTTYSEEAWFKTTTTRGGKIIGLGGQPDRRQRRLRPARLHAVRRQGRLRCVDRSDQPHHHSDRTTTTVPGTTWSPPSRRRRHEALRRRQARRQQPADRRPRTTPATGASAATPRWGSDPYFDGTIDEVAVYSKALTITQVKDHYVKGGAPWPVQRSSDGSDLVLVPAPRVLVRRHRLGRHRRHDRLLRLGLR